MRIMTLLLTSVAMMRVPALLGPRRMMTSTVSSVFRSTPMSSLWRQQSIRAFSSGVVEGLQIAGVPPSTSVSRHKIRALHEPSTTFSNVEIPKIGDTVKVSGWLRTVRSQKHFSFLEVNDGSTLQGIQVIADATLENYNATLAQLTTGAAVTVTGELRASLGKGQSVELLATSVEVVGTCPVDTYPLQKKRHSQEFLRTIAHLRGRTNLHGAVARVRSDLAGATHRFFQNSGFVYLQTPLITASDCEGAGEMFRVTTLPIDGPISEIPRTPPPVLPKKTADGELYVPTEEEMNAAKLAADRVDMTQDFFGKAAFLTVSGQLSGETYACALGDIYTFGPTFRAEKSLTTRHLAEFHMIEPEMAFADLHSAMDNAEAFVKSVVTDVSNNCANDMKFFNQFIDKNLDARLGALREKPFARITYREAIRLLQNEIEKDPSKWQYPNVEFGTDLQTEHERWLAEKYIGGCVFVHNYPRSIKPFYMRDNADGETVDSFDLLVPGVGELIGGSQREERLDVLKKKMEESGLKEEDYDWYLDLRRYGSVPHAGYGLGFERLVCYVTGVENIREAIAYPRYTGHAEF